MTARTVGDILDEMPPVADQSIGANNPPPPTPIEANAANIEDLYTEAANWLDGSAIKTQGQADEVTRLLDMAKQAGKSADTQRAAEKKPHDDAGKAVQAAWKPLIDRAKRIEDGTKAAIGKWLVKVQAEQRAIADNLAQEAREAAGKARAEHLAAAQSGDLAAMEDADKAVEDAKAVAIDAGRAERAKPAAKVEGMGRAVGLMTVWDATLSGEDGDAQALAKHYWQTRRADVIEFYMAIARADVRSGARVIPGTTITPRQIAR